MLSTWQHQQEDLLTEARARGGLTLLGDCRSDSPGHCAKYGTYSMIDTYQGKVLVSEVIQVSITSVFRNLL